MKVILLFIWLVMVFTHYSYAQATDTITIKTFAKENPVVQFNYREPANYDITLKSKYRLLIYFGGRNTTGENEVKSKSVLRQRLWNGGKKRGQRERKNVLQCPMC